MEIGGRAALLALALALLLVAAHKSVRQEVDEIEQIAIMAAVLFLGFGIGREVVRLLREVVSWL